MVVAEKATSEAASSLELLAANVDPQNLDAIENSLAGGAPIAAPLTTIMRDGARVSISEALLHPAVNAGVPITAVDKFVESQSRPDEDPSEADLLGLERAEAEDALSAAVADISAEAERIEAADERRDDDDEAMVFSLVVEWKKAGQADLTLRHLTGARLNERLGNPLEPRQERGKNVVESLSKQIGIGVSDVSRFRHFAHHFKTVEAFQKAGITTWGEAKKAITERNGGAKQTARPANKVTAWVHINAVEKLETTLSKSASFEVNEEQRGAMFERVAALVTTVKERFTITA